MAIRSKQRSFENLVALVVLVIGFFISDIQSMSTASSSSTKNQPHNSNVIEDHADKTNMTSKPRMLCLHGLSQSSTIFSNKIGGARRKLQRVFELDFLNGPLPIAVDGGAPSSSFGWWTRNDRGEHDEAQIHAAFDYVQQYVQNQQQPYQAILGFSQGGLLATALALSGDMPGLGVVVTAGSPHVKYVLDVAHQRRRRKRAQQRLNGENDEHKKDGLQIPKFHFAGETDAIISVEQVQALSDQGGNGQVVCHEKGHLFPTKAAQVNLMMEFLESQQIVVYKDDGRDGLEGGGGKKAD